MRLEAVDLARVVRLGRAVGKNRDRLRETLEAMPDAGRHDDQLILAGADEDLVLGDGDPKKKRASGFARLSAF